VVFRSALTWERTTLSPEAVKHLGELIAEWQLLADLSFADLTLWVPLRKDVKNWPEGHLAVAHIRATTAATIFLEDPIGRQISWGSSSRIDEALSSGEIVRDNIEERYGDFLVKHEAIPVQFKGSVIAVISRIRNIETMRTPSKLELNYREIANQIYRMISQGTFPFEGSLYLAEAAPRVGDGLIRLDLNGVVTFASPNALSAFNRLGWSSDLTSQNLGEVLDSLSEMSGHSLNQQPHHENWQRSVSGKLLKRREFENESGVIDILALPLLEMKDRVGALVLIHDITELRRRDRALISKDATIREMHHRVKNNLQTVSALLRLQSRRIEDLSASRALDEAVRRIGSIALVHETLANNTTEMVAFDSILKQILHSEIDLSIRGDLDKISYELLGEVGDLPSGAATALALIVTELIHNAIEHGLSGSGSGLKVRTARFTDLAQKVMIEIEVSDDGAGISKDFSLKEDGNLGLEIVKTLTENELKGELAFEKKNPGTSFLIRFPL
jgi:two-component sensor histidine kinase